MTRREFLLAVLTSSVLSAGLVLFLLSNKLIDWMHGAEGPSKETHVEEEIGVTGTHEVVPEQ